MEWISVDDRLPPVGVFVIVYEDDTTNPEDAWIGTMCNSLRQRAVPAKLLSVDSEGFADWHLCYVGGGPAGKYRNVTHWTHLPDPPKD